MIKNFVTLLILCLINTSFPAIAQDLEMEISISTGSDLDKWLITYEFSKSVEVVSFEKTPHSFIKSDWRTKTVGSAIDLSSLQVKLDAPANHLSIVSESENVQSQRVSTHHF